MLFVIGACLGSFFCVFAERMPLRENFWSTRSQCPHCKQTLRFYELIPLISFTFLKGKCSRCKIKIPKLYVVAECCYGLLLFSMVHYAHHFGFHLSSIVIWLTSAFVLSLIDMFYYEIDTWLLYAMTLVLWINLFLTHAHFHVATALVCILIYFLGQHWSFIGSADLFLALSWFSWLTFDQLYLLLWSASLLGVFYYYWSTSVLKKNIVAIRFVPFLSFGLLLSLWIY